MPERSALLLLDCMTGLVSRFPGEQSALIDRWGSAREAARAGGLEVVFVRVGFRPGYPEVAEGNALFGPIVRAGGLADDSVDTTIHPELAPQPGDIVVTKRRVSAFTGSDLDVVLRARGVSTVVLAGLVTSGVVLSTCLDAVDRDHRLVVLSDACADSDSEVHRTLMERFYPTRGDVMTTDDWVARLP